MKKIVYRRPDGGVSVVHPAEGARLARKVTLRNGDTIKAQPPSPIGRLLRGWPVLGAKVDWAETEEEFVARIAAKDVPADAAQVAILEDSAIPADRTFRDAWTLAAGRVSVDMAKAREVQKARVRQARVPQLAALDVDFLRAVERGDAAEQARIAAEKQRLRDATDDPRIAAARTPEELAAVDPLAGDRT